MWPSKIFFTHLPFSLPPPPDWLHLSIVKYVIFTHFSFTEEFSFFSCLGGLFLCGLFFFFNFFFSPVFCYSLTLGSLFHSASVSFLPGVCPFPYQLSILPLLLSFQSLLPKVWGLGGISASMNLCKISSIAKIIVVLCLH